ncbi:MAG: hypothetical protein AB7G62_12265 [Magnetospirillum sp.]
MKRRRQVPEEPALRSEQPSPAGRPMPAMVELRDGLTGAMSVQVIDAKAVKRVRAEPHVGPDGRTWLYVVTVYDWADRRMLASGPLPEAEAMDLVRKLHGAVAEAAKV